MYYEGIQRQGYTNNGQLFGDWIGREDKGGQGWITYHLSGNEWIQSQRPISEGHDRLHPRRNHPKRHQLPGRQTCGQGL